MKIYINGEKIDRKKYLEQSPVEVLCNLEKNLNNEVVVRARVNGFDVNIKEIVKGSEQNIRTLNIKTRDIPTLIKETVEEAENYLPRLLAGISSFSNYVDNEENKKARATLILWLEGLEWYIKALGKILYLSPQKILRYRGRRLLKEMNFILLEAAEALENYDLNKISMLLSGRVLASLDQFSALTDDLEKMN